jgi:two-component system, NtrC family, response regulator AtoC
MWKGQLQNKFRVAVIEDNPDSSELLNVVLQGAFDVIVYASIAEAFARIPDDLPNVILCDLMLPDGDGRILPRLLRARGVMARMVAVTAQVTLNAREDALTNGFNEFVAKPILDLEALVELITALAKEPHR